MGKVMRHTLGASLNIRHNLSSSKGPKPLQLKLLTTYIPKTSAFTLAFSTSQRLRTRSEERRVGKECRSRWEPYLPQKKTRDLRLLRPVRRGARRLTQPGAHPRGLRHRFPLHTAVRVRRGR